MRLPRVGHEGLSGQRDRSDEGLIESFVTTNLKKGPQCDRNIREC